MLELLSLNLELVELSESKGVLEIRLDKVNGKRISPLFFYGYHYAKISQRALLDNWMSSTKKMPGLYSNINILDAVKAWFDYLIDYERISLQKRASFEDNLIAEYEKIEKIIAKLNGKNSDSQTVVPKVKTETKTEESSKFKLKLPQ